MKLSEGGFIFLKDVIAFRGPPEDDRCFATPS